MSHSTLSYRLALIAFAVLVLVTGHPLTGVAASAPVIPALPTPSATPSPLPTAVSLYPTLPPEWTKTSTPLPTVTHTPWPTPTATATASPALASVSWPDNQNPAAPLVFHFSVAMDQESVQQALTITPTLDADQTWDAWNLTLTLTPKKPLPLSTTYTVDFGGGPLRSWRGQTLSEPAQRYFTSPSPIASYRPERDTDPRTTIQIKFGRAMNKASVEAAFHLSPEVAGGFSWDKNMLVFTPTVGYLAETTRYTVSLGRHAIDADGQAILAKDFSWSFQTKAFPDEASFGMGPNLQVLNADGRRAVQFVSFAKSVTPVEFKLYRLELPQFTDRYALSFHDTTRYEWMMWNERYQEPPAISLAGAPLVKRWTDQVSPSALTMRWYWMENDDEQYAQETLIPADVPPGLYVLTTSHDGARLFVVLTRHLAVAKRAGQQLTAWVTDYANTPAPAAEVSVFGKYGQLVQQGQTDAEGLYRAALDPAYPAQLVIARVGDDLTVTGLSGEWLLNEGEKAQTRPYAIYLTTDRPLYRPGQTVYFKAIVRREVDAVLSVPPLNTVVTVRLHDARDNIVRTIYLQTNEFGTVDSHFDIAEGAMLGGYKLDLTVDQTTIHQVFKVQDYRKPDYTVSVTTGAAQYAAGQTIVITGEARYLFDQPVVNASVQVKPYHVRGNCQNGVSSSCEWFYTEDKGFETQTDAEGHFTATLTAEVDYFSEYYDGEYYGGGTDFRRQRWAFEATVQDVSAQTVSNFVVAQVYSSPEQLVVNSGADCQAAGQPFSVTARALTFDRQPMSDRRLYLQLQKYDSTRYNYGAALQALSLMTDASGWVTTTLTVAEAGRYQLYLTGWDLAGVEHFQTDSFRVETTCAPSRSAAPQPASVLSLSADRTSYVPGETASLKIASSFNSPALLTVYRGTVRRTQLVSLTAPATQVDLPLLPEDAPNVYVAVQAWQPQDSHLPEAAADCGYAECYNVYYSQADSRLLSDSLGLTVKPGKALTLALIPDKAVYAPRDWVTYTVRVTDERGQPAAAEVALALVDEAIFSLSPDLSGPIYAAFHAWRGQGVNTYQSQTWARSLLETCRDCTGGRGGGGGYEGPMPKGDRPRTDFPDTALWLPAVRTNDNGEAVVTFRLPDNLTTWRLTARAVTIDTAVGEAQATLVTQQAIMVQPVLPRTLVVGDHVELAAIIYNASAEPQRLVAQIRASRLALADPVSQTFDLNPGEQRLVNWAATAQAAGEAKVTLSAEAGALGDAVEVSILIQPLSVPEVANLIGDFTGEFTTTLMLPSDALDISTVKLELSRSIAGNLLSGVEFLTGYPYGCVEQTMSKAFPNAVVGRAFHQLGLGNPQLGDSLTPLIQASIQRLYGYQHNDGGWGWWYDDDSDAYQTAWVVLGLSITAEAGHEIDAGVIQRGTDWLTENLGQMDDRTRAFALYSLATAGYGDLEATRALAAQADKLDTFSQAGLALALQKLGATAGAQKLLATLAKSAVVDKELVSWPNGAEDGHYHQKTMASTTRSTALALEAFVQIQSNHPLVPGIVHYLVSQRRGQGWGSTNETSFTILALTDYLLANDTAGGQTSYQVEINGQVLASGVLGKGQPAVSIEIPVVNGAVLLRGANTVRIVQAGSGRLYYSLTSRLYRPQAAIDSSGAVSVARAYVDPHTNTVISGAVKAGQVVQVQLTVNMPEDGFYMLVEDKLPGGLEALNEQLSTTSHDTTAVSNCYAYDSECGWRQYFHWKNYGYNNKEIRGDRVSFFITELSQGQHRFSYYARATQAGQFVALPAEASAMYDPSVWGRSASSGVKVAK
jgi:alpha-2-macroglobulin